MELRKTILFAFLSAALIFGAIAWTPQAEAWEEICLSCKRIWFVGVFCDDLSGAGTHKACNDSGPFCRELGGLCGTLTAIEV